LLVAVDSPADLEFREKPTGTSHAKGQILQII